MRAVDSGWVMLGRLGNTLASGLDMGAAMMVSVMLLSAAEMPLAVRASRSLPIAHWTGAPVVSSEAGSARRAICVPAGAPWANSAAVREAAAALSFRNVRRFVGLGMRSA